MFISIVLVYMITLFLKNIFLGFLVSIVLLSGNVSGQYWGPHHHEGMWGGSYMGGGPGGWWIFIFLIFIGLLILAILLGIYILFRGSRSDDEALKTIRKMYARGEISDEEFEKKKRKLKSEK